MMRFLTSYGNSSPSPKQLHCDSSVMPDLSPLINDILPDTPAKSVPCIALRQRLVREIQSHINTYWYIHRFLLRKGIFYLCANATIGILHVCAELNCFKFQFEFTVRRQPSSQCLKPSSYIIIHIIVYNLQSDSGAQTVTTSDQYKQQKR